MSLFLLAFAVQSVSAQVTYLLVNSNFSDIGAVTQTGTSVDIGEMRQDWRPYVSAYASGQVDTTGLRIFIDFSPNNLDWKSGATAVIDSLGDDVVVVDTLGATEERDLEGARYVRFRAVPLLGNDATVDVKLYLKVPRTPGIRY
jgi:hypothetical protein